MRLPGVCVAVLLSWFLLRCCYRQPYLSALSLPLLTVVLLFSCTVDFYYPLSERERERGRNRKLTYRYNVIIAYIGLLYSTHVASTFPFYYTQLLRWLKIYIYMSVMTRDGLPKGPTGPMSSGRLREVAVINFAFLVA